MKLTKAIGIYSVANIINASIPFLLLPILTATLLPSEYGRLAIFQVFISIALPFIALNIHGLFLVKFSKFTNQEFSRFVSTIIWLPVISFVFLEFLCWLFIDYLSILLGEVASYIYLAPLVAFVQVTPLFVAVLFQAKQEPFKYGFYKISLTVCIFILALIFVLFNKSGWLGVVFAYLIASLVFSLIGILIFKRMGLLHFYISWQYCKEVLSFGVPLIPYAVLVALVPMVDRFVLLNELGAESVGIYSVAYQVSGAVLIVMMSINQAWAPYLFNQLNSLPKIEQKIKIVHLSYKIVGVMFVVYLVFTMSYPLIYALFINSNYFVGQEVVPIIALAFLFQGCYFVVTNYIFYVKKTIYLTYIMLFVFLVIVGLNILFVPLYGIKASAYALVVGYFLLFIMTWFTANKVYKMPWDLAFFKNKF